MPTNDFDTSVMPSARAARAKQARMLAGVPLYIIIAGLASLCILGSVLAALIAR